MPAGVFDLPPAPAARAGIPDEHAPALAEPTTLRDMTLAVRFYGSRIQPSKGQPMRSLERLLIGLGLLAGTGVVVASVQMALIAFD
jgi:hypothetical protein